MIEAMTPYSQASDWLQKQPAAISGSGGHNQTYHVATTLVQGYSLGRGDVESLMREYNARCSPPWSESELAHKISSAFSAPADKPAGYALRKSSKQPCKAPHRAPAPRQEKVAPIKLETLSKLPQPVPDGARALLRAVFREGEGVRIAAATLNEEKREVPQNEGPCLSREEWLRKLDAKDGNPNGIFSSTRRTGIYITINPLRIGGSKDSDVTAFRHALVEFDNISREEQWTLYESTRLPCAAIISSGGKSIHAWVKVDARDRKEYDERVRVIYDHFAASGFVLDTKNKNPSRLSRLPNCVRFSARQELLALDAGAGSFTEWLKELANADLRPCETFKALLTLDTRHDPNCVIGFRDNRTLRYLCKGKGAWLIGPSGIGKSSLLSQFAIGWARGTPVFGIHPRAALRSLIVQAENDRYDLAEMVQGIARAHGLNEPNAFDIDDVNERVVFYTETTAIGPVFADRLQRLIDRERPDVVWVDPLLSFSGIKISEQDQATHFLRTVLQPVLEATGVVLIGIHHTGKPKSSRDVATWTALDHAYSGIGSSELVNWARAVMVLHPHGNGTFELKLAKRGRRAGASNPDTTPAYETLWLEHAATGILWNQINPPAEPEAENKEGHSRAQRAPRETKPSESASLYQLLTTGPSPTPWQTLKTEIPIVGESGRALSERISRRSANLKKPLSAESVRKNLIPLLTGNQIRLNEETGLWVCI